MRTVKVIAGLGCIVATLFLAPFAWVSFVYGNLWFKFVPVVFILGLVAIGVFLILKRRLALSKNAKTLITVFISVLTVSLIMVDVYIRCDRKALQNRAREFLSRPVPTMLETNSIDGYQARPNESVLSGSRALIERYANNGRIRWSAAIQGQFARQPFETASCEDADVVKTNEEARRYVADCKAIIDEEWRMGFWQWVEDTIEMRHPIPEIEEENRVDRFIQQLDGTWTNSSSTLTIEPGGRFSSRRSNQNHTNTYGGTWMFRGRDGVLVLIFTNASGAESHWPVGEEAHFRVVPVDDHNLVYEVDNQTNSMSR